MSRRLPSACLLSLCLCSTVWPAGASAHVGHVIARAERYLKLDVSGRSARVVVSLTLGPEEGRRVLEAADTNGDGEVGAAESDAYLAQWAEGLRTELPIFVDEAELHPSWGDGYFDPIGAVRDTALTVEMVAIVPLEGGEQTVSFEDRMVRREVFDRTDVAFRARDGASLIASGAEEAPTEPTEDLFYLGDFRAGEPIPLTARLSIPEPPDETPYWLYALGALLAVSFAIVLFGRLRSAR